ncbi:MAG: MFS transporter [Candidatus Caenarcaniphilales bacterium]|jgi:fucose permease|nr:MFS transporter [Candidatus Caenarcaniphilales bacterium]
MKNTTTIKNDFLPLLIAVAFAYFAFGAITNVAGAIIPKIREAYAVSASLSSFLAATFFIAYGLTSIPWGVFMEKSSKKTTLIISSIITTAGVLLFAAISGFVPNMAAMFLCGIGITGIQVALNPLVAEISDPAKYSRNLTAFMVVNGIGSYLAPQLVSVIKNQGYEWTMTYWVFTVIAIIMTIAIAIPKYPTASKPEINNGSKPESKNLTLELLTKNPLIYLYAVGIFLYVGVEVGVANTLGFYLQDKLNIEASLGEAAEVAKNTVISNYWGRLLVGRLIGSVILDKIPGRIAIMSYISLAAVSLYFATHGSINQALIAFPAIGFFISIMFPTIYSLATNSFPAQYSSAISGILCTAIIGGAAVGPLIAAIAEATQGSNPVPNWDMGLYVAYACYAYIFFVGLVAKDKK